MQCPKCGHNNNAEATTCSACGIPLQNSAVSLDKPQQQETGQPASPHQPSASGQGGYAPQPGHAPQPNYPPQPGYPPGGYPPPGYGPSANDPAINSGTGSTATLPTELKGLNWGSFFLTLFWAMANQVWWGLLVLVPCIGAIMPFVLLFKGNEWAWQNRRWQSSQQFRDVQRTWGVWGLAVTGITLPFTLLMVAAITFPVFARARENARRASCQSNLKQMSLAIMQYSQDYDDQYPLAKVGGQGSKVDGKPVGWADALLPYMGSSSLLQCPSDKTPFSNNPLLSGYSDYVYNSSLSDPQILRGGSIHDIPLVPASVFMLHDGSGSDSQSNATYSSPMGYIGSVKPSANDLHLDGANYAYMDGHVKWRRK